jgi:hypothetical protein
MPPFLIKNDDSFEGDEIREGGRKDLEGGGFRRDGGGKERKKLQILLSYTLSNVLYKSF